MLAGSKISIFVIYFAMVLKNKEMFDKCMNQTILPVNFIIHANDVFQLSQTLAELKITDYEINSNDIEKGDKLGRGAFADVFRLIISMKTDILSLKDKGSNEKSNCCIILV